MHLLEIWQKVYSIWSIEHYLWCKTCELTREILYQNPGICRCLTWIGPYPCTLGSENVNFSWTGRFHLWRLKLPEGYRFVWTVLRSGKMNWSPTPGRQGISQSLHSVIQIFVIYSAHFRCTRKNRVFKLCYYLCLKVTTVLCNIVTMIPVGPIQNYPWEGGGAKMRETGITSEKIATDVYSMV